MTARHLPVFGDPADIVAAQDIHPGEILARLVERPAFVADAACRLPDAQHIDFFPKRGRSAQPALQVCGRCPVREACRQWALDLDEPTHPIGVLGGMSGRARRAARAARGTR